MAGKQNTIDMRITALKHIMKEEVERSGFGHVTPDVLMEAGIHCQSYDHVYYFLFGVLYCGLETTSGTVDTQAYYEPKLNVWLKIKPDQRYVT